MATLHAYLNFNGNCEEAFKFYQAVFETESLGMYRFGQLPEDENSPPLSQEEKNMVMHTAIKINEYTMLMGSDMVESFCAAGSDPKVIFGTGTYLSLNAESAEEANNLYRKLSANGKVEMPLGEQFFAELYASFIDQFGIGWMINFEGNKRP